MDELRQQITQIQKEFSQAMERAINGESLESVRVEFLGRKGKIAELMPMLKSLSDQEKREVGPLLNQLKMESELAFEVKKTTLDTLIRQQREARTAKFDVTAYQPNQLKGTLHPYTYAIQELEEIFVSMGFEIVDGPELETEFFNFDALNVPRDHPARDMQDTIWLPFPERLMRTQTSAVQVHQLQHRKPPFAVAAPGRTYRYEATDASHDYVFMQCEGLLIRENVSMAELLATMKVFLQRIFGKDELALRVRPGFFPFTEPGIEIDIQCPFCSGGCATCKKTRWIESCGAGLVHPNVLRKCGLDADKYSAFAFGFGLTRLIMLKYGINDIRLLHNNSIEFLEQFS